jgi:hypothetical protein
MRRNRDVMPVYGKLDCEQRFGTFLKAAVEQCLVSVEMKALFRRCYVRLDECISSTYINQIAQDQR